MKMWKVYIQSANLRFSCWRSTFLHWVNVFWYPHTVIDSKYMYLLNKIEYEGLSKKSLTEPMKSWQYLLSNAYKFSGEYKTTVFRLMQKEHFLSNQNKRLAITVIDNKLYQIALTISKDNLFLWYLGHSRIPAPMSFLHTLQYICLQVHSHFVPDFELTRNASLGHNVWKLPWTNKMKSLPLQIKETTTATITMKAIVTT